MRVLVCVKQIYDPETVKISRSREEFDLRQAIRRTNPLDRYALEAALRLRETAGGEVIALTAGDVDAEDAVRDAVAMGADRGVLVEGRELAAADGGVIARVLKAAIQKLEPVDLVLTGKGDPISGTGSLAGRLAAELTWPAVLDVVCMETAADGQVQCVVPDSAGAHAVPVTGPAVVAICPGLERPRYPHARRIANAYQAGLIDTLSVAQLDLETQSLDPESETGGLVLGPERTRGQQIGGTVAQAAATVAEILRAHRVL